MTPPQLPQAVAATGAVLDLCEDRAWLNAFRAGDAAALEKVFRVYARVVFVALKRGLGTGGARVFAPSDGVVEDLLQDVFVRVLSKEFRARYDGVRPFDRLLRGVARHVLVDHLRRSGREHWVGLDHAAHVGRDEPSALDTLLSLDECALVAEFLDGLTPPERQVAQVRFAQGQSQRDTAAALGMGRQQVRTLEEKIQERLAAFMATRQTLK